MEIQVATRGVSCHGSAPERGENAIYKMAPILLDLQSLNEGLRFDSFLGKGSLTVSEIFFSSPSRCAVADGCTISIDRRLTAGETAASALHEIRDLHSVRTAKAEVEMYGYREPSYTGLVYPTEAYFPTWTIREDHPACQTLVESYRKLFNADPVVDKWTFSTNGVAISGRFHIPCVGFGPGHEDQAHAPDEKTWKSELVKATAMYAVIPSIYLKRHPDKKN
jgi:putative selenium metabolism hydrolase